jgi:hypothetical protein
VVYISDQIVALCETGRGQLEAMENCRCLLHRQEQGGQDRAFQFQDGLVNYKAHYDLSRFRPLLRGNSHMSSGLILNMNRGYNGVGRELEKFMW